MINFDFLALISISLFLFGYLAMILWIFIEMLVRTYFAFLDREYIPTWITRNFHIVQINIAKIGIPIIIVVGFFGGVHIFKIVFVLSIFLSVIYTDPSALKLYNPDKNDSSPRDSDGLR